MLSVVDTKPLFISQPSHISPGGCGTLTNPASMDSFLQSRATPASSGSNRDIFYCENYFDMDDILSQSNRVAVTFNRTIPKLGFLDPGAEDDDLVKGTKLGMFYDA